MVTTEEGWNKTNNNKYINLTFYNNLYNIFHQRQGHVQRCFLALLRGLVPTPGTWRPSPAHEPSGKPWPGVKQGQIASEMTVLRKWKNIFLILLSVDDVWCNLASIRGLKSLSHVIKIISGVIGFLVHVKTVLIKLKMLFIHEISKKRTTSQKSLQIKSFYLPTSVATNNSLFEYSNNRRPNNDIRIRIRSFLK